MSDRKPGTNRGNAGKGRPKGSRNRTTSAAKATIEDAVEGLGGADRLRARVRESPENERVFWSSIFPRLLPLPVTGKDEEPFQVASHVLIVLAKEPDDTVVRPLRPAGGDMPHIAGGTSGHRLANGSHVHGDCQGGQLGGCAASGDTE